MRNAILAALALLTTLIVPGLAAAHAAHFPCPESTTTTRPTVVHVDVWRGTCVGVVVSAPDLVACRGAHTHTPGAHALVLYGSGCQTGVIVQFLRTDDLLA